MCCVYLFHYSGSYQREMSLCLLVVLAACQITLADPRSRALKTALLELPSYDGRFDAVDNLPPAPSDLRYAFVIFRHGIRSPLYKPFKTKSEYDAMWPEGLGALTDDGKRLMFHVGQSLKTRYNKLVPVFDERTVQFTSTLSDRALKSAASVAAGLFRTNDYPILEEYALSTKLPVPVLQGILYDKHKLFSEKEEKSRCRRYRTTREQVKAEEKEETPELRKEYYDLLNSRISKTFHKDGFVASLPDSSQMYDIFKAQMLNQKSVPTWVPTAMPVIEKMKQLRMWFLINSKPSMIQYFVGPLFHQILSEMEAQSLHGPGLKIHFHGSHDITVCPTVWAISLDETYLALPGDTVMMEMTANGLVKVYLYAPLQKEKDKKFKEISLEPVCGKAKCSLDEFKNALKNIEIDEAEWNRKCSEEPTQERGFRHLPQDINQKDLNIMQEALNI